MAFISGPVSVAITGGARGIGLATAQACARAGMKVAIGDIETAACARAAAEIGSGAVASVLDVRDAASFAEFLDAAEDANGPLDVL